MRKIVSFGMLFFPCILMMPFAFANSAVVDGYTWYYTLDGGEATIYEVEPFAGDITIPAKLDGHPVANIGVGAFEFGYDFTSITISDGILNIGEGAFSGCRAIEQIAIPGSVTNIDAEAFVGCMNLSSVTTSKGALHIGDSAFASCSKLSSVILAEGLQRIGDSAFSGCTNLSSVTTSKGSLRIGDSAFASCSKLSSVILAEGLQRIGDSAFSGCETLSKDGIVIPQSVESIGVNAFEGTKFLDEWPDNRIAELPIGSSSLKCAIVWTGPDSPRSTVSLNGYWLVADGAFSGQESIQQLLIGEGLQYIGANAFAGCAALGRIDSDEPGMSIPGHVKSVGDGAFEGCAELTVVTLAGGVVEIGARAFAGCAGLESVSLPSTLERVGDRAFEGCTSLESVNLPEGVEIGRDAFAGCSTLKGVIGWYPERGAVSTDAEYVIIADGVTEIPDGAFAGCQRMKWVSIPNSVTNIRFRAFAGCQRLESVDIPEGVVSIGNYAFSWCLNLRTVTLPSTLKHLGDYVFDNCDSLKTRIYGHGSPTPSRPTPDGPVSPIVGTQIGTRATTLMGSVTALDGSVVGVIGVKVGKAKTKNGVTSMKVSATVTDLYGKKRTTKSVTATLSADAFVHVPQLVVKGDWGALDLVIGSDGFVGTLGDHVVGSAVVGAKIGGDTVSANVDFSAGFGEMAGEIQTLLLPQDEVATVGLNGKWTFAKAAGVKLSSGLLAISVDRGRTNRSGLKLTYTPKTGMFKGSFRIYAIETVSNGRARLRKYTAKVSGLVVDGVGVGVAVLKNPSCKWSVMVR